MSIGSQKNENIEKVQILLQFIVHCLTLVLFRVFFVLEVKGKDKALEELANARLQDKGILFASNHISEWDAIMVRCALPFGAYTYPMYYVAMTKEHYQNDKFGWRKYFYGGTFFKMLGAYPAYLGMRDYQASLVNHIELLEYGKSICIFPEGKISINTAKPGEAKGGVGFLAEYTKTNIIPVTLEGFGSISWRKVLFGKRQKLSVIYQDLMKIEDVLELARKENITEDIEINKFVGTHVMDKIRSELTRV
jgi:1-acyl-sn-glycerol-3-phosphate acyltransferase